MDDWDSLGPGMKIDRRASDWGTVSLVITGLFLVMAPIQLIFNSFYWVFGLRAAAFGEVAQARIATPLVLLAFFSLIGFGLFAGFRGMSLARSTGYPIALPLAGILVGCVDVCLWLALGVNMLAILGVFE